MVGVMLSIAGYKVRMIRSADKNKTRQQSIDARAFVKIFKRKPKVLVNIPYTA